MVQEKPGQTLQATALVHDAEGGKWEVTHFWRQGTLFARILALRIPFNSSLTNDDYVSPGSRGRCWPSTLLPTTPNLPAKMYHSPFFAAQ